jgi:hypothetical protein
MDNKSAYADYSCGFVETAFLPQAEMTLDCFSHYGLLPLTGFYFENIKGVPLNY